MQLADPELPLWLDLALIPGLGPERLHQLLSHFGSLEAIYNASPAQLSPFLPPNLVSRISQGMDPAQHIPTLEWLQEPGNHLVTWADPEYPQALLDIHDPPILLYAKGRLELANQPGIGIVGSRHASDSGMATAEAFAKTLSDAGLTVISGLALGIDAAAHRGGLACSASSIAVVGTGLDRIYPARNKQLAHQLAEQGLILSEFALGTPVRSGHFPRRNRIISGLSRGVLVVEAALGSGSLITAREALEQGREVFAIPGSIHSPLARGCHALIKQGAKLVECARDVLEELKLAPPASTSPAAQPDEDNSPALLQRCGFDPFTQDWLAQLSGESAASLSGQLLQWELEGWLQNLGGGRYQRLR